MTLSHQLSSVSFPFLLHPISFFHFSLLSLPFFFSVHCLSSSLFSIIFNRSFAHHLIYILDQTNTFISFSFLYSLLQSFFRLFSSSLLFFFLWRLFSVKVLSFRSSHFFGTLFCTEVFDLPTNFVTQFFSLSSISFLSTFSFLILSLSFFSPLSPYSYISFPSFSLFWIP